MSALGGKAVIGQVAFWDVAEKACSLDSSATLQIVAADTKTAAAISREQSKISVTISLLISRFEIGRLIKTEPTITGSFVKIEIVCGSHTDFY